MNNLKLKHKLLAMGCITGLFLLLLGGISFWSVTNSASVMEKLYQEELQGTEKIGKIGEKMRNNRIQLLLALQHDPRMPTSKLHDHPVTVHTDAVVENIGEITKIWESYVAIPGKTSEQKKLIEEYTAKRGRFVQEGLKPTREAVLAGDFDLATKLTIQAINPLATDAFKVADQLYASEYAQARQSIDQMNGTLRTVKIVLVIGIVLAMVIGTTINLLVVVSIDRGTRELLSVTGKMAHGDLSVEAAVLGGDELGQIAQSFNGMRRAFVDLIGKVVDTSAKVTSAATLLYGTSEQIATGAEEVAAQTGTVATAGEEMAATSGEIALNCQRAAEGATLASEAASNGAVVVERTIGVMSEIAAKVQESARTVETLGTRSDQIGAIIGTIEDIADQTNLLALNAAIEAARAGEQGRGFAVVADEVRALAERTTKATREIGEMIKAIQGETRGAVVAMEQGVHQVEAGTSEAAKSGAALQEILDQVNAVAQQVNQIATAAEQQTATTSEISNNIQQITEVVEGTARGAQESASEASQLARHAEELQRLVGQFRLV